MFVSKKRFSDLQEKYDKIQDSFVELDNLSQENKKLQTQLVELKVELQNTKQKVREQTEADLFFVSAKIQKKLLDGEPKEAVQGLLSQQQTFQNALQPQYNSYNLSSLFSMLGWRGC